LYPYKPLYINNHPIDDYIDDFWVLHCPRNGKVTQYFHSHKVINNGVEKLIKSILRLATDQEAISCKAQQTQGPNTKDVFIELLDHSSDSGGKAELNFQMQTHTSRRKYGTRESLDFNAIGPTNTDRKQNNAERNYSFNNGSFINKSIASSQSRSSRKNKEITTERWSVSRAEPDDCPVRPEPCRVLGAQYDPEHVYQRRIRSYQSISLSQSAIEVDRSMCDIESQPYHAFKLAPHEF
jgi:hypothetical protein